jgi:hypothetical protein
LAAKTHLAFPPPPQNIATSVFSFIVAAFSGAFSHLHSLVDEPFAAHFRFSLIAIDVFCFGFKAVHRSSQVTVVAKR